MADELGLRPRPIPRYTYLQQRDILSQADELRAFIEANKGILKTKDQAISQT